MMGNTEKKKKKNEDANSMKMFLGPRLSDSNRSCTPARENKIRQMKGGNLESQRN